MGGTALRHRIGVYRKRTHELLDPEAKEGLGFYVNWSIMGLIALNVGAVILETVDPIHGAYAFQFRLFEVISVTLFTVEYVTRVWSKVEDLEGDWHPVFGRLRAATDPILIVDLLAILPFYLALAGFGLDLRFLRAMRLIRLLRLLKLVRYSESMRAFGEAFRRKKHQFAVAMTANFILLIIAASLMFFAESEAQPEAFGSIPETMWWAVVTLTTVGYGDVAPITPLGRVLGGIVAVLGIGLFALPASIMASGFVEVTSYERTFCPDCGYEIGEKQDLETVQPDYREGDWIRIDVAEGSLLDYEYHGDHGVITDAAEDIYEVALHDGAESIRVSLDDLRTAYKPRDFAS